MKHFYICIVIFFIIVFSGIITDCVVNRDLDKISAAANRISIAEDYEYGDSASLFIKNQFYSKKNMLLLFVSKEHIKELETEILLLENALKNNDIQAITDAATKIQLNCYYARGSMSAFD